MATITFLSPRRGSGTTTAVASVASALYHSSVEVNVVDRTANKDFSRWWPTAPATPERIDDSITLIDAHEPSSDDSFVCLVYDDLTEPNPSLWLATLLGEHPHLVIIGAIINRTTASPAMLDVPGRPTVRVKPLPHHHLLHDAALQGRWLLDISALSSHHVRLPALALGPHIIIALSAAQTFPELTPPTESAPNLPNDDTPPDSSTAVPIESETDDRRTEPVAAAALDNTLPLEEPEEAVLFRTSYSVPNAYRDHMMGQTPAERRQTLAAAVEAHLDSSALAPFDEDDGRKRSRLSCRFFEDDVLAIRASAQQHDCQEWQLVSALLEAHLSPR